MQEYIYRLEKMLQNKGLSSCSYFPALCHLTIPILMIYFCTDMDDDQCDNCVLQYYISEIYGVRIHFHVVPPILQRGTTFLTSWWISWPIKLFQIKRDKLLFWALLFKTNDVLVNVSLKFQMLISQIRQLIFFEKISMYLVIKSQNTY